MTNAPAVLSPAQEAAIRQSFARQGLMQQTIAPVPKRY